MGEPAAAPVPQPRSTGLGRGLAAILPRSAREEEGLREIPVDLIRANARQPRADFDGESLIALAESIGARGVLQPVVVRPLAGGEYELIAGERRVRASRMAGLDQIPAIVREADDSERLELALIENMAREDLSPVEEARACATLVDDLGVTKEELGRRLGRSRAAISNLIRLLDLPDEALEMLARGELSEGHGRALLMCRDHDGRRRLGRAARDEGWSVRETERRAREEGEPPAPRAAKVIPADLEDALAAASDALTAALGRDVAVRRRARGFRVEIDIEDPAEAVALAERLLRRGDA